MPPNIPSDLSPVAVEAAYWYVSTNGVLAWGRKKYIGLYKVPGVRGVCVSRSEIRLALQTKGPRKMRSPRVSFGVPVQVVALTHGDEATE